MKIAFIGGRDIHKLGGIENYMYNLATQLVKMGHEPIVFCESDHNGEERLNGFRVIYRKGSSNPIFAKPILGVKNTKEILKIVPDVDLIHYNGWPPSIAGILARRKGILTVMQGHGFGWKRTKYPWAIRKVIQILNYLVIKFNTNLIMCSKEQTKYYESKFKKPAPTVPTAINPPDLSSCPNSDIPVKFNIASGKFFLFIARLVQDKNPDYLIKAFNNIDAKNYKLVIAGNNPSLPKYVEHLHDLAKGNPNIIFTDAVYGQDKDWLFKNAFAFCLPSSIEGLAISLLEAMSYRLPIIASNIVANKEVLDDDKALWVHPENTKDLSSSLQKIINQPDILKESVEYNYNKVANIYTWEKVAKKYISIVSSLK